MIDSSNHLYKKLVPLIVRYFHAEKGVMVKVLELVNLGGETSDLLLSYMLEVFLMFDIYIKCIIDFLVFIHFLLCPIFLTNVPVFQGKNWKYPGF
jgi:hypothetical protein